DLGDLGALDLGVTGLAQYWPHVFSLGVSVKPTRRWQITAQVDYLLWENAPNDQVQVTMTPTGNVLQALGLDQLLSMQSSDAKMGFKSIFVPHLAVEYLPTDFLTLRAGGYVRPSVIPDQNGVTNYLD